MINSFIISLCAFFCADANQTVGRQYSLRFCVENFEHLEQYCADPDIQYFYEEWRYLENGRFVAGDLPDFWASPEVRKQIMYRDSIPGC